MTKILLAGALLAAAALAGAQTQKPAPEPQRKSGEPPRLNLKLDQPARLFVQETPAEKNADNLPSLGGSGSASFERARDPVRAERQSPYPKDTENINR